jgi:hemerythrin-like domain-containing protein
MHATDILENEHRVIEQVLNCLEVMANRALAEGKLDVISADAALEFFQVFADGCHHRKEENYLFPLMEAKGFPREGGPTGVMLHEHQEGPTQIQAMRKAVEEGNAREFATHARAYVELLRNHIFKEDHRLFPMANQLFADKDQAGLMNCFEQVEHREVEEGAHQKYLDIADMLALRFQVPRASQKGCGCGHTQSCGGTKS